MDADVFISLTHFKVMRWLDLEVLSRILEWDVVPELVRWNNIVMENHN